MPKNEDGEFELILGNKQLLSMFFVVVILLGVFFVMGYIVGRNSAPVANVEPPIHKPSDAKPTDSTAPKQVGEAEPTPPPSTVTATQAPETKAPPPPVEAAKPVEAKPAETKKPVETAKAEPPPKREPKPTEKSEKATATKAKAVAQSGTPAPGIYLQLSATSKADADAYVEVLRKNGFQSLDAEVPENPKLYRVLVGPVPTGEMNKLKDELKSKGMPADSAVRTKY